MSVDSTQGLVTRWFSLSDAAADGKEMRAAPAVDRSPPPFHFGRMAGDEPGAFTTMEAELSPSRDGRGVAWKVVIPAAGGTITWKFRHLSTWLGFEQGPLQVAVGADGDYRFGELPGVVHALDNDAGAISVHLLPGPAHDARCHVRTFPDGNPTTVDLTLVPRPDAGGMPAWVEFEFRLNALSYPLEDADIWEMDDPIDLRTTLGGVYAGAASCLGGAEIVGSAYPTMRIPRRAYGALHTFFDIDAYFTVAVLCLSGDPRLEAEARRILQRAAEHQLPSGQVPHHFDGEEPVWLAISGASQAGPNLFWLLAVHDYTCNTADESFLRAVYPAVRRAVEWLEKGYDPARKLIRTDGPLWIDVFRKEGFTYDVNAMAIWVLERIAPLCGHCGDPAAQDRFSRLAAGLREGIEALWETDHFITSLSPEGTRRDMWDSDNYSAVAFDLVTDPDRAGRLLHFLDALPDTHPGGKATWVSGKYYDAAQCYLGNTGDSACAMARLFWIDLKARHRVKDPAAFQHYFGAVRQDFLDHTWMGERYDAAGGMIRAEGYAEYPEILALSLRESWYGIELGFAEVSVRPLKPGSWTYANRRLRVRYDPADFQINVPGTGLRRFVIEGLPARTDYRRDDGETIQSDARGRLVFDAPAGELHRLRPVGTR